MSIAERLINWWEQRRVRQKAAEEDAALLMKLLGDGAYGEASRKYLQPRDHQNRT
jgi:hypothetical protein